MSSSSDHEDEYEVEAILSARLTRRGRKRFWEFHVKWQGYDDPAENTWEPYESFFDKEMIEKFWLRVDTGGRDVSDLSAFEVNDTFFPRGPPRRKPKAKKAGESSSAASRPADKSKTTHVQESKVSDSASAPPPRKREREEPTPSPPKPVKKSKLERLRSTASSSSKGRAKSSDAQSEVPPSEASEEEMDLIIPVKKVQETAKKSRSEDLAKKKKPTTARPKSKQISSMPIEPKKKKPAPKKQFPAISDESDSEEIEEVAQVPPTSEHHPSPPTVEELSKEKTPPQESPKKAARPISHRERAKQPRITLLDDTINPTGPGTSAKSRIFRRFGEGVKESPNSRSEEPNASQRISKNKSSVLTFSKGKLLTQKGKYRPEPQRTRDKPSLEDSQTNTEVEDPELWGTGDAWEPTGLLGQISAMEPDQDVAMAAPDDPPRNPTEDLRDMAAATAAEGDDLPDFEEEESPQAQTESVTGDSKQVTDAPNQSEAKVDGQEHVEETAAAHSPSTALSKPTFVQNTLFSDVKDQPSASSISFTRRTTIFDNAAYAPSSSLARSASVSIDSPTYTIYTESNKSFPVALDQVDSSPNAMGLTLEAVFKQPIGRIPGKFYSEETAMRVLRCLRPSGHAARVVPPVNATEEQIKAFDHFHESLQGLRLFIAMAGQSVLAYCLSNTYIATQLNFPSTIASLNEPPPGRVVVCRVNIEDPNAYAGLIDLAE